MPSFPDAGASTGSEGQRDESAHAEVLALQDVRLSAAFIARQRVWLCRLGSDERLRLVTTVQDVPDELRAAVHQWRAAGSPEQPPSRWSPTMWQSRFVEREAFLSTLPRTISRADVIERCLDAPSGPEQATQAFIAAMIWGYGPVGYGAFRTLRVLSENENSGERLANAARIARDEGGPAAFQWLAHRPNRLRNLGVAFATKYLFFCAATGDAQPALVLDRMVRNWLASNLAWPLSLEWNIDDYREYVESMCGWAEELSVEPGNLEMLVFQLAANADPQSLWSAPELFASDSIDAPTPVPDEIPEASTLVEMLDYAAATFAVLPGKTDPDELADFQRGIRELQRIVLARR